MNLIPLMNYVHSTHRIKRIHVLDVYKRQDIKFLDDQTDKWFAYEIIGSTNEFYKFSDAYDLFISIGDNKVRRKIAKRLREKACHQVNLIHPSSVMSESVTLAEGICIMPNAVINAQSQIGEGCIINTSSSIDHENFIKDFVHISPGCHLSGQVTICLLYTSRCV